MHARAQTFGLSLQRVADKQAGKPGIAFDEAQQQIEHVAAPRGRLRLLAQDEVDAGKQRLSGKHDEPFEHFCLGREVPVQRRFGYTNLCRQTGRGDAIAGSLLQHPGETGQRVGRARGPGHLHRDRHRDHRFVAGDSGPVLHHGAGQGDAVGMFAERQNHRDRRGDLRCRKLGPLPGEPPGPRTRSPEIPSALSGDLDWLALKALEQDRDRRYESPSSLAANTASIADRPE